MTREELDMRMISLLRSPDFPVFDAGALGEALIDELEKNWDILPESSKALMLGISTSLRKHYAEELVSCMWATDAIERIRKLK